jgi:ComF family protein
MLRHLFAGTCFLCRGEAHDLLCEPCAADLPRLRPPRCPCCALASPAGERCGRCLAHPPAFDATVAALGYVFPADALVQALKFRGQLSVAPVLARCLDEALGRAAEPVACVVPVPLSAQRLRARGFNQALEIARCMDGIDGRLQPRLLARARETAAQFDLPWSERQRNVRGAFRVARPLAGATVAVVDDVMTTGATLEEIARTLKAAGASRVVNWVVARTPAPD